MKKHLNLIATGLLLSAGTAMAGDVTTPVVFATQIVPPSVASDWSGFYAGGMVSLNSAPAGLSTYQNDVFQFIAPIAGNTSVGGFAGYDFQFGSFIVGGEVAINTGSVSLAAFPNQYFGPVTDLKLRAGYIFGNVMAYGVVGASYSKLADYGSSPMSIEYATSGLNYGAGVEYLVGEKMFVGAEYLFQNLAGSREGFPQFSIATTIQSAQLRVGWKF